MYPKVTIDHSKMVKSFSRIPSSYTNWNTNVANQEEWWIRILKILTIKSTTPQLIPNNSNILKHNTPNLAYYSNYQYVNYHSLNSKCMWANMWHNININKE